MLTVIVVAIALLAFPVAAKVKTILAPSQKRIDATRTLQDAQKDAVEFAKQHTDIKVPPPSMPETTTSTNGWPPRRHGARPKPKSSSNTLNTSVETLSGSSTKQPAEYGSNTKITTVMAGKNRLLTPESVLRNIVGE